MLVIVLLMALLTIFGGSKPKPTRIVLPGDARVVERLSDGSEREGGLGNAGDARVVAIVVRRASGDRVYPASERWRVEQEPDGTRVLLGRPSVNKFLEIENLVLVAKDASFIAIMAVGMTAVIVLAGIDLSVGSIYGMSAIMGAMALHAMGADASGPLAAIVALAVCVGVGGVCGAGNGAMIVGLRVHPFVITLGTMAALRGLTIIIPQRVYGEQSIAGFPPGFTSGIIKAQILGVYPVPVIIMAIVAACGWFVLARTVFGRRVFAIGGNEIAARYAGIPVGRVKLIVYAAVGALAGLSAWVYLGYLGAAETSAGTMYELRVIAAAVIGGASLMGGRGSALGAVLGAIVIELINNAMIILSIDQSWNQVVMGAAIIVAVVIDQAKRRLSAR